MKYTCVICGKEYDYCHSCSIDKDIFKNAGYCDKNCYDISMLIQSYRSNVTSAEDAAKGLKEHNADTMTFVPGVAQYVNEINGKATLKVEANVEPEVKLMVEPIVEPEVETIAEPIVEPIVETIVEPEAESEVETTVEPNIEPIIEKTTLVPKGESKPFYPNRHNRNKRRLEESLPKEENTSSSITDKDTELLHE